MYIRSLFFFYYRPTAVQVMEQLHSVSEVEDDAAYDLVELINKVDKGESNMMYYDAIPGTQLQGDQYMKRRIESFKVKD